MLVHGILYSKYYKELGYNLALHNFDVHLFDFLGFGYSGGVKNNPSGQDLLKNIFCIMQLMDKELPLYVIADCQGCVFMLSFLILYHCKVSGMVMLSPLLTLPSSYVGEKSLLTKCILRGLGWIFDEIVLKNYFDMWQLFDNKDMIWRLKQDLYM